MLKPSSCRLLIALTTLSLLPSALFATQQDLKAEADNYVAIFKGSNFAQQRKAIEPLGWSGFSDPVIYDIVAEKLLEMMVAEDKTSAEQASWYAKALALSGNEKYRSVLSQVANEAASKKVRKHAQTALDRLDSYTAWNPVITQNLAAAPAGRLEQARIANMLAALDFGLLRIGAKRVYHGHPEDEKLVNIASNRLASEYKKVQKGNKDQIDAVAWLIKVMAQSGDAAHKPLLLEIAQQAEVKKVRKYAKKYAEYL